MELIKPKDKRIDFVRPEIYVGQPSWVMQEGRTNFASFHTSYTNWLRDAEMGLNVRQVQRARKVSRIKRTT